MVRVNQFQEGETMFRGRKKTTWAKMGTNRGYKSWVQFPQMHNKSSNY